MISDLAGRAHLLPWGPDGGRELPLGHRATPHPAAVPRPAAAGPRPAAAGPVSFPPFQNTACQMGLAFFLPGPASLLAFVCSGREAVRQDIQNNRAVAGWEPGGRSTWGSHKVSLGTCCGKGKKHFFPTLVPAEELVWHTNGCLKTEGEMRRPWGGRGLPF